MTALALEIVSGARAVFGIKLLFSQCGIKLLDITVNKYYTVFRDQERGNYINRQGGIIMRKVKGTAAYQMDVNLSLPEMVEVYYRTRDIGNMLLRRSRRSERPQYLVTYDRNEAFEKEAALMQFEELGENVHYVPRQVADRTWNQMKEEGDITFFRILVNDEHRLKLHCEENTTLIRPYWNEPIHCNVVTYDIPAEKRWSAMIEFHNSKMIYFSELEQEHGAKLTVEGLEQRRNVVLDTLKQQIREDEKLQNLLARFPEDTRKVITGAYIQGVFECMNHPYQFPNREELGEFMKIEDEIHHHLPPAPATAAAKEENEKGDKEK